MVELVGMNSNELIIEKQMHKNDYIGNVYQMFYDFESVEVISLYIDGELDITYSREMVSKFIFKP